MGSKSGKKCDISDNFLICRNKSTCKVTSKTYKTVIYPTTVVIWDIWYVVSCVRISMLYLLIKITFKPIYRVQKSNINTCEVRHGAAKHFLTKYADIDKIENTEVQLFQQVEEGDYDVEVRCGVGKCVNKPNCSFCCIVWTTHGTGTAQIEKVIRKRKCKTIFNFDL